MNALHKVKNGTNMLKKSLCTYRVQYLTFIITLVFYYVYA